MTTVPVPSKKANHKTEQETEKFQKVTGSTVRVVKVTHQKAIQYKNQKNQ